MDTSPRPVSVNPGEKPVLINLGNQRHGPALVNLDAGTKRRPQPIQKRAYTRRAKQEEKNDG